jgi:uncharacterized RDD family membrane protein YckC
VYCSRCGAALAGDAAFCQACGSPVTRVAVATANAGLVSPHAGVGAIAYVSNVVYAGFWLRFAAYLIDRIVLGIATVVLFVPFFFLFGGAAFLERFPHGELQQLDWTQLAPLLTMIGLLVGLATLLQWLYFAYLESGENQATWGKQMMSIYVTDLEGKRLSFGHASGRFFSKIITGMVPLFLGYIMAGFTERRQALHDLIAGTLVLRR